MTNETPDAPMYIHPASLRAVGFYHDETAIVASLYPSGAKMTVDVLKTLWLHGVNILDMARFYLAPPDKDQMLVNIDKRLAKGEDYRDIYSEEMIAAAYRTMSRGLTAGLPVYFAYETSPLDVANQFKIGATARIEAKDGTPLAIWFVEYSTPEFAGGRIVAVTLEGYTLTAYNGAGQPPAAA